MTAVLIPLIMMPMEEEVLAIELFGGMLGEDERNFCLLGPPFGRDPIVQSNYTLLAGFRSTQEW